MAFHICFHTTNSDEHWSSYFLLNNYMPQCLKLDSLGLTRSGTLLEGSQVQKEHLATGSRLLQCGSMELSVFTYFFSFRLCAGATGHSRYAVREIVSQRQRKH